MRSRPGQPSQRLPSRLTPQLHDHHAHRLQMRVNTEAVACGYQLEDFLKAACEKYMERSGQVDMNDVQHQHAFTRFVRAMVEEFFTGPPSHRRYRRIWPWLTDHRRFFVDVDMPPITNQATLVWSRDYRLFFNGRLDNSGQELPPP